MVLTYMCIYYSSGSEKQYTSFYQKHRISISGTTLERSYILWLLTHLITMNLRTLSHSQQSYDADPNDIILVLYITKQLDERFN